MTMERSASFAEAPALRMTCASPREIPKAAAGSMRASMQVRTRYFLAGGRAKEPWSNEETYSAFFLTRLSWMADMMNIYGWYRRM